MRKRNHTVTIRMNKEEYDLFQSKVKESGRTQQEVVIQAIADLKITCQRAPPLGTPARQWRKYSCEMSRGSGRTEKTEPDVCGYPLSAPGSYDKYQPDCKKTAYRWRNPKRQYVVLSQQKYSQIQEGE